MKITKHIHRTKCPKKLSKLIIELNEIDEEIIKNTEDHRFKAEKR